MTEMNNGGLQVTLPSDFEIKMERVFYAPRAVVFQAVTNPTLIPQWWGPIGMTTLVERFEFYPGGKWRFVQSDTDGNSYGFGGVIKEIVPSEKIVQTFTFDGMPGKELLETTTFEERDGKTYYTQTSTFDSKEDRDGMLASGMESGATESLVRLTELLPSLPEENLDLILTRVFDAPRELVFKAWTTPELMKQWWAPAPFTTPYVEIDARPGGIIKTIMKDPDGNEYPTEGKFIEVVPPEKLVFTDLFTPDGAPSTEAFFLATLLFEDIGGRTKYTAIAHHYNPETKQQHEEMGFHIGWNAVADQLTELLKTAA